MKRGATAGIMAVLFIAGAFAQLAPPAPTPIPQATIKPVPKRKPKPLVALPNYDEETSTRLQIFLDNNNFGPGKIDGKMGEFFRKALVAYKIAHGIPPTGTVERFLAEVPQPYTTYTITPEDEKFVGPAPTKPSEQAKLKALLYGSYWSLSPSVFIRRRNTSRN